MKIYNCVRQTGTFLCALLLLLGSSCSKEPDLLTYRYDYDLSQYLDLAPYEGLDAKTYAIDITDERVETEIYATLSYYARTTPVTGRGAEDGDLVTVNYTAVCEGEEIENETERELMLGMDLVPATFEDAVRGHYAGDTFSFDLTLPSPYEDAPEYSGKLAHYEGTLSAVNVQELPVYTDDFVRGYLGYDSIADYEAAVRQKLYDYYEESLTEYIVSQTWPQVVENSTVKSYPKAELDDMTKQIIESNQAYADLYKMGFAQYLQLYYKMTEDEFTAWAKEQAQAAMKEEMISYAIARAENLTLSEEEYTERATEYALEQYELDSLEALEELYGRETIRQTLLYDKVRELVAERANRIPMEGDGAEEIQAGD